MYCNFSSMHITYFSTWLGMHYNLSSTLSLYSTKQFLLLFVIFDLCMLNSAIGQTSIPFVLLVSLFSVLQLSI